MDALIGFAKERIGSVISKKVAATGGAFVGLDGHPWAQAAVIVAYLLAQAYSDSRKG